MPTPEWVLPAFETGVKAFSDACPAAQGYDIHARYKGPDISSIEGWVYFSSFVLLFEYTAHSLLSEVNSLLECKLMAEKNNPDALRYSLMDVFNALELDDFRCALIPSIASETAMAAAFQWLGEIVGDHLPAIAALLAGEEQHYRLYACFTADVQRFFPDYMHSGYDVVDQKNLDLYYGWLRGRFGFAQGAYMRYLGGNPFHARKKLARTKKTLLYERRLLAYLDTPGQKRDPLPPMLCEQIKGPQGTDARYVLAVFASWIPLTALCLPFWLGVFYLLRAIAMRGQLLLIGPDPFEAFMPAFLTAIVLSFFTRRMVMRLLFRRRAAELLENDAILFSRGTQRFMKGFLYVVFLGGMSFLFVCVNANIAFGEVGFTDNRAMFSMQGEYHPYAAIDHVYYKPDRINGFGETIPFDSYVLVLRDGEEIDLYEHCETSFAVEKVLPLLEEKGVSVWAVPPG